MKRLHLIAALIVVICQLSIVNSEAFRLPDTGQTKCYQTVSPYAEIPCAGTGQDGAYSINPLSYTDNGNGTVTDNNTGLIWQKCSVGQNNDGLCGDSATPYNWYQASGTYHPSYNPSSQSACGSLSLGGYIDWRLPAKKELLRIVYYSTPYPGSAIVGAYFPDTQTAGYWSSTTYASSPGFAWAVGFSDGFVGSKDFYNIYYVRCVRGGQQSGPALSDNGNGTVTDTVTGLIWQQGEVGGMAWGSALSYCEELSLGEHSDWRLPNVKELESLTDDTRYNPSIDISFFPYNYSYSYWSSTTQAYYPYYAWFVNFYDGSFYSYDKYINYIGVRCVRGGQSGSLGSFDHLEVTYENGGPIWDKTVGQQFPIKITARDVYGNVETNFSGSVSLSDSTGSLSTSRATLSNGIGFTTVVVNLPSINNRIYANYNGLSGVSNEFQVIGNCSNLIAGKVKDNNNSVVSNASVILSRYGSSESIGVAMSDPDGTFSFGANRCGNYQLYAEWNNHKSPLQRVDNSMGAVMNDLMIDYPTVTGSNIPVVLVPGYLGSSTKMASIGAKLPKNLGDTKENLVFYDPVGNVGWNAIQLALIDNDYHGVRAPYDWRMSINLASFVNAIDTYLIPALNKAKTGDPGKDDPNKKVHVIAHSLGGLLVRSYIQSHKYRNDIDKFVMMGTPNNGGAEMYYLYEGGDMPDSGLTVRKATIDNLFEKWNKKWKDSEECTKDYNGKTKCNLYSSASAVSFLREQMPSARQVLPPPGEKYLYDPKSGAKEPKAFPNGFLKDLNDNMELLKQKVTLGVCYGDKGSSSTTVGINLEKSSDSKTVYPDGIPQGHYMDDPTGSIKGDGDGTVPLSSATYLNFGTKKGIDADHAFLPKACKDFVVSFVTGGSAGSATSLAVNRAAQATAAVTDSLTVDISPGVTPLLTDPSGKKYGIDTATGLIFKEMTNTSFEYDQNGGGYSVSGLQQGQYRLDLKGNLSRDIVIKLDYIDAANKQTSTKLMAYSHNDIFTVTFNLNPSSPDPLTVNPPVPTPTGLTLQLTTENKNKLVWNIVTGASGYNVYRVSDDQTYPQFLGTTTVNNYTDETALPDVTYRYALCAVTATGTRGFLTEYLNSDDRDGDGLTNSQEALLGTNPDKADSDGDGFSDSLEVQRGSNPQDKLSVPTTWLSVVLSGFGGGGVNSDPAGIACTYPPTGGTCVSDFPMNSTVKLLTAPDKDSLFGSWSGACTGSASCAPIMTEPRDVTAIFNFVKPAKVGTTLYDTLAAAYSDSAAGTILAREYAFTGDLKLDAVKNITIKGGYNAAYTAQPGISTINGKLTIGKGSLVVDRVVIK